MKEPNNRQSCIGVLSRKVLVWPEEDVLVGFRTRCAFHNTSARDIEMKGEEGRDLTGKALDTKWIELSAVGI
jgi:hypothetical protein